MESPTATSRARYLNVRFEDSCVLIPPPDLSKPGLRPRLIRKSYSLPLWKTTPKKATQALQSNVANAEPETAVVDEDKADKRPFSLTVSVPSLTIKSKPRRPSLPPSPCLSKRNASSPTSTSPATSPVTSPASPYAPHVHIFSPPTPLIRTPTFPPIQPANLKEAATVPLRPCCEACHACVDAALAEGERWAEKWSSGAVRRYSESENSQLHARPVFGVTRIWSPSGMDVPLAAALQVDEVEVKRRSSDGGNNARVDEMAIADSDDEVDEGPPMLAQHEEDEDLLFPLPSPRRTPNTSPYATPISGSQVSLTAIPTTMDSQPTRVESPVPLSVSMSALPAPALPVSSPLSISSAPESPDRHSLVSSPVEIPRSKTPPRPEQGSPTRPRQRSASQPRRPSLSSASGSLLKGSAAMLKGVAAGMTGATIGVVR